jgi:hypothetical protein
MYLLIGLIVLIHFHAIARIKPEPILANLQVAPIKLLG